MFLTGDNSTMWNVGNLMGIVFFAVIIILGIVVYKMVAGGSSIPREEDEE